MQDANPNISIIEGQHPSRSYLGGWGSPSDNLNLPHQVVRFVMLGTASAIIDIGLLIILVEWTGLHYLAATALSFLGANTFNYVISRQWIFIPGKYGLVYEYTGFLAASGIGLSIHQIAMLVMVGQGHFDYRLAKVVCITMVTTWNFITRKYLVFVK
jgi:putative flippase GtrA